MKPGQIVLAYYFAEDDEFEEGVPTHIFESKILEVDEEDKMCKIISATDERGFTWVTWKAMRHLIVWDFPTVHT